MDDCAVRRCDTSPEFKWCASAIIALKRIWVGFCVAMSPNILLMPLIYDGQKSGNLELWDLGHVPFATKSNHVDCPTVISCEHVMCPS